MKHRLLFMLILLLAACTPDDTALTATLPGSVNVVVETATAHIPTVTPVASPMMSPAPTLALAPTSTPSPGVTTAAAVFPTITSGPLAATVVAPISPSDPALAPVSIRIDSPAILDDSGLQIVGRAGVPITDVAVYNAYAYVVLGDIVQIIDFSDPARPQPLNTILFDVYEIVDIKVYDTRLYVQVVPFVTVDYTPMTIYILDLAQPSQPALQGSYEQINLRNFAVDGDYIYALAGDPLYEPLGLHIINISNPTAANSIGFYPIPELASDDFVVTDGRVYVTTEENLLIIDVSQPTMPVALGRYPDRITGALIDDVFYHTRDNKLLAVDLSDPAQPKVRIVAKGVGEILAHIDNHFIVRNDSANIRILAVRGSPADVAEVAQYEPAASYTQIEVSSDRIYLVQSDRLAVVELTNPASPRLAGIYSVPVFQRSTDVAVRGNTTYIMADNKVHVLDVTLPSIPRHLANYDGWGSITRIFIMGDYMGVIDSRMGGDWVNIVNVSQPHAFVRVSAIPVSLHNFVDMAFSQPYLYLADANGIQVFDLNDVANPQPVTSVEQPVNGITATGNHLYFATDQGLGIFDVSQPTAPTAVGFTQVGSSYDGRECDDLGIAPATEALSLVDVAVVGDYAYVIPEQPCLVVIDISDPGAPTQAAILATAYCQLYALTEAAPYFATWGTCPSLDIITKIELYDATEYPSRVERDGFTIDSYLPLEHFVMYAPYLYTVSTEGVLILEKRP